MKIRHLTIYIILITSLLFGCNNKESQNNETPPNIENLARILNSENFRVIITSCHGNILGTINCGDEILYFDHDTLKFKSNKKTYVRLLNKNRRDSLYKNFQKLIDFHQPNKNIGKDGFGCLYHDYNYTFKNDSIELTIKPYEGNGIYYKIQDIVKLDLLADIVNWEEDIQQLDSTDFILFNNHKIVGAQKLVIIENGKEKIACLHLKTTLGDTSLTIIPVPNPHYSLKQLSPVTFVQNSSDFYDFVILPDRYVEDLSESDTILNTIIGMDIQRVDFEFKLPDDKSDKISGDIYGVKSQERFLMCLKFTNNSCVVIENEGLTLNISRATTYNK